MSKIERIDRAHYTVTKLTEETKRGHFSWEYEGIARTYVAKHESFEFRLSLVQDERPKLRVYDLREKGPSGIEVNGQSIMVDGKLVDSFNEQEVPVLEALITAVVEQTRLNPYNI